MSEKYKKTCKYLNYVEVWLILAASPFTGYFSISAFVSVDNTSSAEGINICAITARIKKYRSISKKRRGNMIT